MKFILIKEYDQGLLTFNKMKGWSSTSTFKIFKIKNLKGGKR